MPSKIFILLLLLIPILQCAKSPSSNESEQDNTYTTLSVTEFLEPALPASQIEKLTNDLALEFGASLGSALKIKIDAMAGASTASGKRAADTLHAANAYDTLIMAGLEALMKGSLSTALYAYLQAAEITPGPDAYSKIGFALNYMGRYGEARVLLLAAKGLDSAHTATRANLAYSYRKLGSLERAIYEQRRAVALSPRNSALRIRLAQWYVEAKQPALARAALNMAHTFDPGNAEIAALLSALPAEGSEPVPEFAIDPLNPPSSYTTISDSIAVCRGVIDSAILDAFAVEDHTSFLLDQEFSTRERASNEIAFACANGCEDNACFAGCLADECNRNKDILNNIVSREKVLPFSKDQKISLAISQFQARAYPILMRNPDAIDYNLARNLYYEYIRAAEEHIDSGYALSQADISVWADLVAYTCEDAAQAWNAVDWEAYYASHNDDPDFDVCLFSVCVNVGGSSASFSFGIGILQAELSLDMTTGQFGVGVGTGISLGYAEAGVMLRMNSSGAHISADAGLGGPIPLKQGTKYDLFNW